MLYLRLARSDIAIFFGFLLISGFGMILLSRVANLYDVTSNSNDYTFNEKGGVSAFSDFASVNNFAFFWFIIFY